METLGGASDSEDMYEFGTDSAWFNLCGIHPPYSTTASARKTHSLPRLQCCVWIHTTGPSVACCCWSRRSCWSWTILGVNSTPEFWVSNGVKAKVNNTCSKSVEWQHWCQTATSYESDLPKWVMAVCSNHGNLSKSNSRHVSAVVQNPTFWIYQNVCVFGSGCRNCEIIY